ncbi:MAG TPA: asparagine synthase-related protein, partial [Longimicrobiaceae bacterium]|nr:asparagine synthase-related protein [Longimicrobiaceae bacterium]
MSAFAGCAALDGAPEDAGLAARLAECLRLSGFEPARHWQGGGAALAHARLPTGDVGGAAEEPLTLDGERWIVADARLDDRPALAAALRGAGLPAAADAPAAELILLAHRAWGEACPPRLLGDFAFAIWDAPRRRLFCARDHFGLKSLYYARAGGRLVFSTLLQCLRGHPGVGSSLDDAWIADFLIHAYPQDLDTTVYAAIRQLPPAHALTAEDGQVRVRRWWELSREHAPLRLRGPAAYADAFTEVLGRAVVDRLPNAPAAIFFSGGRDSTAVAALAQEAIARGERQSRLLGLTAHYERMMPDREREFAALAAGALGFPVHYLAVDGYAAYGRTETPALARPQPSEGGLLAIEADQMADAAAHGPVLFTGLGGDPVLRESPSRLTRLLLGGHPLRAAAEAAQYAWWHRRLPRPGARTWLRGRRAAGRDWPARVPPWIAADFARRVGLPERVAAYNRRPDP